MRSELTGPLHREGNNIVLISEDAAAITDREEISALCSALSAGVGSAQPAPTPGSGRGATWEATLNCGRSVVVRALRRGGVARWFSNDRFVFNPFAHYRPFFELSVLSKLRAGGVNVPEPIAALVEKDGLTYRGYFVSAKIDDSSSLAQLAARQPAIELENAAFETGKEVRKVIEQGFFHPDMHPGNVLFKLGKGPDFIDGGPVLIDFDNVKTIGVNSQNAALERTRLRWARFIRKYHLAHCLDEAFARGLRERRACPAGEV
jgi:hypothetical protein